MNKTVKNILIAIFVPTAIAAVYFGYQFYSRRQKELKILEELKKALEKKKTVEKEKMVDGMEERVISGWKSELSKLKGDDFDNFFNYFMITIPYGKVQYFGFPKPIWITESTEKEKFDAVQKKALASIAGKEIEKMFKAIEPEK